MEYIFVQQINGNCSTCSKPIENGGYLVKDRGKFRETICSYCKSTREVVDVKPAKLKVKQVHMNSFGRLIGSFFGVTKEDKFYEVIKSKNLYAVDRVLDQKELLRLMEDKNIEVDVDY